MGVLILEQANQINKKNSGKSVQIIWVLVQESNTTSESGSYTSTLMSYGTSTKVKTCYNANQPGTSNQDPTNYIY